MVSSSLDKKSLQKDKSEQSDSANADTNTNFEIYKSDDNLNDDRLPANEKIQLMFPKCKPRNEYQYQTTLKIPPQDTPIVTNFTSIASSSSSQSFKLFNSQANGSANNYNMNNRFSMKPQSPDHKKQQQKQFSDQVKNLKPMKQHEQNENYVETNPFRIGSNNQYFYSPNDLLYDNNNSALAAPNNNSMLDQYQYLPLTRHSYQGTLEDRNYFLEPDEIEHNPYMIDTKGIPHNTIPASILKTSPPETPPALATTPRTTPVETSPFGSNRNIWDLSPIKNTTPSRIKTQSPIAVPSSRSNKGSYKKLLASPVPIEEDLETGHFYYNNKKPYYQALQTDSDSNEPAVISDVHEVENTKPKALVNKPKMKHSESHDFIYTDVKKKEERKILKSKSGSGIMEYDGSPRRFGTSLIEDNENPLHYGNKFINSKNNQNNFSSPSPPRPGFPQRVLTYGQHSKSPNDLQKQFPYNDQMEIHPYTASSKLIQTTLISSNEYDAMHENEQIFNEELEDTLEDSAQGKISYGNDRPISKGLYNSATNEDLSVFQVTSPTEENMPTTTFDYLYEFSETRKVLEEFFKCPENDKVKELGKFSDLNESDDSLDIQYDYREQIEKEMENIYNKQQKYLSPTKQEIDIDEDNRDDREDDQEEEAYNKAKRNTIASNTMGVKNDALGCYLQTATSRSSLGDDIIEQDNENEDSSTNRNRRMSKSLTNNNYFRNQSKNFNYSPDTTDYDSNCGDFDYESESPMRFLTSDYASIQQFNNSATASIPSATVDLSGGPISNYARYCTSMPVLEDGLSSGHASDNENNNQVTSSLDKNALNKRNIVVSSISTIQNQYQENLVENKTSNVMGGSTLYSSHNNNSFTATKKATASSKNDEIDFKMNSAQSPLNYHSFYPMKIENKDFNISPNNIYKKRDAELETFYTINNHQMTPPPPAPPDPEVISRFLPQRQTLKDAQIESPLKQDSGIHTALKDLRTSLQKNNTNVNSESSIAQGSSMDASNISYYERSNSIARKADSPTTSLSPVWIPRSRDKGVFTPLAHENGALLPKHKNKDEDDEDEIDTDLETDRLLGHQILDDGFYDDKVWTETKQYRPLLTSALTSKISPKINQLSAISKSNSSTVLRHGLNVLLPTSSSDCCINSPSMLTHSNSFHQSRSLKTSPSLNNSDLSNMIHSNIDASPLRQNEMSTPRITHSLELEKDEQSTHNVVSEVSEMCNISNEIVDSPGGSSSDKSKKDDILSGDKKKKNRNKEVLIEGVLFRARYLGSTQLVCEGQPTKSTRMMQAEEAVSRIKALAPDGENQPSTEVDLFISTEKIMVLNTDLKEIMMDHALRTISYIADIGDLVVLMARRRFVPQDMEANSDSGTGTGGSGNVSGGSGGPTPPTSGKINRTPKMICHVFESEEAQFIAQSIGQAFQVAYMEFLKANGIEDHSFMKEMDYQEVLNSQEIFGDELEIFAKKELQKEVVVPKAKGEILGVVIVESGWGSMLPTVVIANLASNGAAARCGQLNIGDQIIAINGLSLVGLPLSQCQTYIKNTKNQTVVKFTVVPCAPVVEVKIKRPNTKYQLGFSVQNGVICSLLRGGIAERGGVRVGHRIIEINNQSVVAVPHEKIVNLLATSVGEILMKTMPTSMFRLLTGQENPIYI